MLLNDEPWHLPCAAHRLRPQGSVSLASVLHLHFCAPLKMRRRRGKNTLYTQRRHEMSVHQSPCLLDFTDVILDVTHECECVSEHNVPSIHSSPLAKSDGVHQS